MCRYVSYLQKSPSYSFLQAAFLVGRFLVSELNTRDRKFSPFNVVNSMPAPFFSRAELAALLGQYEADMQRKQPSFKVEPAIIDHILYQTGGA